MVQIDWLSINYHGIYNDSKQFKIKHREITSKYFKNITEFYHNSDLICILSYNPRSSVLSPELIQIKYSNKVLYFSGLFDYIAMIEKELELVFIGFSRIDICYDFNAFAGNLFPDEFIRRVVKEKYIKKTSANYKFMAVNGNGIDWQYFRIGSVSSNISAYLYNKTMELEKVHDKPYIREQWKQKGLILEIPVWRLEFTLKGSAWDYYNLKTGAKLEHKSNMLRDPELLDNLYIHLVDKLFTFYKNSGKSRKDREEKLILFDHFKPAEALLEWCPFEDSTRSDKILINKLLSVYDDLRNNDEQNPINYYMLAKEFSYKRDLKPYFDKLINAKNIVLENSHL